MFINEESIVSIYSKPNIEQPIECNKHVIQIAQQQTKKKFDSFQNKKFLILCFK